MAEDTPAGEKTEAPSAKRRADFRKKGQVAQSKEVQTAILFTVMLLFWYFYAGLFFEKLMSLITHIWSHIGEFEVNKISIMTLNYFLLKNISLIMFPIFTLALVTGVLATFMQIGWNFTTEPLIPNLSKLNPIQGMAKLVSKQSFVEIIKSILKVFLIGLAAFQTIRGEFQGALILSDTAVMESLLYLGRVAALVLAKICGIMILLAFLDFLFTRYQMEEKMKMTKQEQKEEMKEAEGDPHIKSKIRSIQQAMARRRMMAAVPEADVIITNPTHIAVAVQYRSKEMDAPIILAKGQELIAQKIKEIGRKHDIPIIENPPVARLLHSKVEIGKTIPEELFRAVAEILAHVYSLKGKKI